MPIADVTKSLSDLANNALNYAVLLAAVGTFTMAFLELVKSVFDLRLLFNRQRFGRWTAAGDGAARAELLSLATGTLIGQARGRRGLLMWVRGEIRQADVIFDQPAEKMLGQIQAAANVVMDFPGRYAACYSFLTQAGPQDAATWLQYVTNPPAPVRPGSNAGRQAITAAAAQTAAQQASQARARLANLVARKLDAFQNETQYLWAEYNQRASFLLGTALILYLLWPQLGVRGILPAFMGGLIAPFAKDLVSSLSSMDFSKS